MLILLILLSQGAPGALVANNERVKVTIVREEHPRLDIREQSHRFYVVRDPETGKLRAPTPDERARFATEMSSHREGIPEPTEEPASDGSTSVVVGSRFMSYLVYRKNADGTRDVVCREDLETSGEQREKAVAIEQK